MVDAKFLVGLSTASMAGLRLLNMRIADPRCASSLTSAL
jgi:hypothetical protein